MRGVYRGEGEMNRVTGVMENDGRNGCARGVREQMKKGEVYCVRLDVEFNVYNIELQAIQAAELSSSLCVAFLCNGGQVQQGSVNSEIELIF